MHIYAQYSPLSKREMMNKTRENIEISTSTLSKISPTKVGHDITPIYLSKIDKDTQIEWKPEHTGSVIHQPIASCIRVAFTKGINHKKKKENCLTLLDLAKRQRNQNYSLVLTNFLLIPKSKLM